MTLDASYALIVVGVALSPWPWLALVVAGAYLGGMALLHWRMAGADAPPAEQPTTPEAQP